VIKPNPRIIVVGGGIAGASITWHLAKRGACVTLLEKLASAGLETTQKSFSWVGTGASSPLDNRDIFEFRRKALGDYSYLREELGLSFPAMTKGAIIWKSTSEATKSFVHAHNNAGSKLELISRSRLRQLEPSLRNLPEVAAFAVDDFAVDPIELTNSMLNSAQGYGASISFDTDVLTIEKNAGGVCGVRTESGFQEADVVVLANGTSVNSLINQDDLHIPLESSPAVLLRFRVQEQLVQHVLTCPDLEIRQAKDGLLLVAENLPIDGQAGLARLAENVEYLIRKNYLIAKTVELESIEIGNRPYPVGEWPTVGFLSGASGLFVAVGHPGVILAPFIGRAASSEILDGHQGKALINNR
jgi:glycine/D-amino acid oxidase-like deaminating enzyme